MSTEIGHFALQRNVIARDAVAIIEHRAGKLRHPGEPLNGTGPEGDRSDRDCRRRKEQFRRWAREAW